MLVIKVNWAREREDSEYDLYAILQLLQIRVLKLFFKGVKRGFGRKMQGAKGRI